MHKYRTHVSAGTSEEEPDFAGILPESASLQDAQALIYELQARQSKLEAENEVLRDTLKNFEKSRARYCDLYNFAPIGFLTIDRNGMILESNLTTAKLLQCEREGVLNQPFLSFVAPGNSETFHRHLEECLKSKKRLSCGVRIKTKNGDEFYAMIESVPVQDAKGNISLRTSMTDITDRVKAEEALKQSEKKYRKLVETLHEGIWVIDSDWRTTFVNQRMEEILGYTAQEIMGKEIFLFIDGLGPDYCTRRLQSHGKPTMGEPEFALLRKDGSKVQVSMESAPIVGTDGEYKGAIACVIDISKRISAEKAARETETRYRTILNIAIDGFWVLDFNGRLLEVNDAYSHLTGYNREELFTLSLDDIEVKDAQHKLSDRLEKIREEGYDLFETSHRCKDGRVIEMEVSVRYLDIQGGRFFVFLNDITKRKVAERELNRIREDLTITLTHDMKGPLASIEGYLQLLINQRFGDISEKKIRYVKLIQSSVDVLLSMIDNIVGVSMLEAGQICYSFEDFRIEDLIRELYMSYEASSILGEITLDFRCPADAWVWADRRQIRRVLDNLLNNAMKHTRQGGTISISVAEDETDFIISVSNTGSAIPQSEHKIIFQKYGKVKGERRGTGLGLYIVKSILEGHNSGISIVSTPGKETQFVFKLKKGTRIEKAPSLKCLVILISVNENAIYLIRDLLNTEGYFVEFVSKEINRLERVVTPSTNPALLLVYRDEPYAGIIGIRKLLEEKISTLKIPARVLSIVYISEADGRFSMVNPSILA